MSVNIGQKGATLLELLIAVVLVITVVVFLSITFPKASATQSSNRQRMLATQMAASRVQEFKTQAYPYIPLTPEADFGTVSDCNCKAIDMGVLSGIDATLVNGGITYTRVVCTHLVDNADGGWVSFCPDSTSDTDKGLKNIRVRVTWVVKDQTYFTEAEDLVAR